MATTTESTFKAAAEITAESAAKVSAAPTEATIVRRRGRVTVFIDVASKLGVRVLGDCEPAVVPREGMPANITEQATIRGHEPLLTLGIVLAHGDRVPDP